MNVRLIPLAALAGVAAMTAACSNSSSTGGSDTNLDVQGLSFTTAAAVGYDDGGSGVAHCIASDGTPITQTTSESSCYTDAGTGDDSTTSDYGATMNGSTGNDDDCKYLVSWQSTAVSENAPVYFQVTVDQTDPSGQPVTGAPPRLEVYLDDTHPAPNTTVKNDETTPGTYVVGPILFDAPGDWTVRFHVHEECADILDDSPHGHAAFFVQVP